MSNWILNTNPDDYRAMKGDTQEGAAIVGWTVDRRMERLDRVVLYGNGSNKTFGFLGDVLTDPVQSEADGNWWSWIEVISSRRPLALADAKKPELIGSWPSLKMMHWTARQMPERRLWRNLVDCLLADSPDAQRQWEMWSASAGEHTSSLPVLRNAYREFENTDGSGTVLELRLQRQIKRAWIAQEWGRPIRPGDSLRFTPGLKLGSAGFADILLVDINSPQTLQVIEVKRAAKPGPKTDGITQLSRSYVPWLESEFPDWRIKPILVALNISPSVLTAALRQGIECWEYNPTENQFDERQEEP